MQLVGEAAGGIRKHVHSLLRGLDRGQFRISYAYSSLWVDASLLEEIDILRGRLEDVLPLPIRKRPSLGDFDNLRRLWCYVRNARVDVIHAHGAMAGVYGRLLGRFTNAKVIYTPHGGAVHRMFSAAEGMLHSFVERMLVGSTDYYVMESQYSANALFRKIGKVPRRWVINHNGIDQEFCNSGVAASANIYERHGGARTIRIGVFAILRKQKGQRIALGAVAPIIQSGRSISLHCFGDGPDRQLLEEMATDYGIRDSVFFYGWVKNPESYMRQMDLILIPSLFESFGYVAVEAMMLGKPIIASKTGGLCEIVTQETGVLFPRGDIESLSNAVIEFLENREHFTLMGQRGTVRVKECFDLGTMLNVLERVYQEVIPSRDTN